MKIEIDLKEDFKVIKTGESYELPNYKITKDGVLKTEDTTFINFATGINKEQKDGVLHENLIAVLIHDLNVKNDIVHGDDTTLAVFHLKSALNWLRARQIDRIRRNVINTYQK